MRAGGDFGGMDAKILKRLRYRWKRCKSDGIIGTRARLVVWIKFSKNKYVLA